VSQSFPHANAPVLATGAPLDEADLVVILNHGRGSTADNILGLAAEITPEGAQGRIAFIAPQAEGNAWYPYRYIEPIARNEPWLGGALAKLDAIVDHVREARPEIPVVVGGFSQGACLALEYLARGSRELSGAIGLAGGLIGPSVTDRLTIGDLDGTQVFIGVGTTDVHIPVDNATESAAALKAARATVDFRTYPNMDHTINQDEIEAARSLIAKTLPAE